MSKETKAIEPDDLKTPEQDGSLSSIIEKQRTERVLEGHPAEDAVLGAEEVETEDGEEKGAAEAPGEGKAEAKAGETPPAEKEEKPEEAPPVKKTMEDELPEGWTFRPKYKDHQSAEAGARAAETKMHEATTHRSELERENERLKKENEELKAGKKETPAQAQPQEQLEERLTKALTEIDQLDDDDPDYSKKRGQILARAYQPMETSSGTMSAEQVQGMISEQVNKAMQEKDKAAEEKDNNLKAFNWYNKTAADAGLDMSEGSPDRTLFWDLAHTAPQEEGVTAHDQVNYLVERVNQYRTKFGGTAEDAAKAADRLHKKHTILEKGGQPPAPPPPSTERASIASVMDKNRQARRI